MRKLTKCLGKTKAQISYAVTTRLISSVVFATQVVHPSTLTRNFKLLAYFCDCTGRFVSALVGTQIVGFLTHRLKCLIIEGYEICSDKEKDQLN